MEQILDSPLAVVIYSFKRKRYLAQLIKSLEENTHLQNTHFYFFQDGTINEFSKLRYAKDQEIEDCIELFERADLPNKKMIIREKNVGFCLSAPRARKFIFRKKGYKHALFLENDLILSKYYLRLIKLLLRQFKNNQGVGTVQCIGSSQGRRMSKSEKLDHLKDLTTGDPHFLAWATWREKWKRMREYFLKYYDLIKNRDCRFPNRWKIKKFFDSHGFRWESAGGQDKAMAFARFKAGMFALNTVVNRIKYIGKKSSFRDTETEEQEEIKWYNMKLDEFKEDKSLEEFEDINEQKLWQIQNQIFSKRKLNKFSAFKLESMGQITEILRILSRIGWNIKVNDNVKKILATFLKAFISIPRW